MDSYIFDFYFQIILIKCYARFSQYSMTRRQKNFSILMSLIMSTSCIGFKFEFDMMLSFCI